jgi:putative transposase
MGSVKRHTTFSFTLLPNGAASEALKRHVGAARFAFNRALRLVRDALDAHRGDPSTKVPWSGFDLINSFNAWKRSDAAGVDEGGDVGLPWRDQVCQQVFEEAAVDLGRALTAFSDGRKGKRRGRRQAFRSSSTSRALDSRSAFATGPRARRAPSGSAMRKHLAR